MKRRLDITLKISFPRLNAEGSTQLDILIFILQIVCKVVALMLHYLYESVFFWMFVEALHLYRQVIRVFGSEKSYTLLYMLIGWGKKVICRCG